VLCKVLGLVRPLLNALALCLGLVLVTLAYLLPIRCFHSPSLYSEGLVVLQNHTNRVCGVAATMYRRGRGPRWFGQKLDCEDSEKRSGRGHLRDPLACREGPGAIRRVTRSGFRPLRGYHCEGLQQGLGGSVSFSIPR